VADPPETSPSPACYHAEFGHSRATRTTVDRFNNKKCTCMVLGDPYVMGTK